MSSPSQSFLIIGGGLGIGLETTKSILSLCPTAKIVVFGLQADPVLSQIRFKERVWIVLGDVTSAEDRSRAVDKCLEEMAGVDTMVYCAGVIGPIQKIDTVDVEAVKKVFDVNVFGSINMVYQTQRR